MELTPVFVLIVLGSFTYGIVHLGVRRKERMTLIEKGITPPQCEMPDFRKHSMMFGLLFIGIALGVLIGNILVATTTLDREGAYFSMVFLFAGIALMLDYFIDRKHRKQE